MNFVRKANISKSKMNEKLLYCFKGTEMQFNYLFALNTTMSWKREKADERMKDRISNQCKNLSFDKKSRKLESCKSLYNWSF